LGQRIGKKGEALVQIWATDNHLTPEKIDDDYGVDFFCQVMVPVSSTVEEATGQVLAIQVKSVEGRARKRVKFDRVDAENALRIQVPFCLLAVDVSSSAVHHRLLDLSFLNELHQFLRSDHKSITFNIKKFSPSQDNFRSQLSKVARPGYQQRLRWQKASLDLETVVPGGRLEVKQSTAGGLGVVSAPWITSLYKVDPQVQREVASVFFEKGKLPSDRIHGFTLKSEVSHVPSLVEGPTILIGGMEAETELHLDGPNGIKRSSVKHRKIGDEWAYITATGLVLSISDRRYVDGKWIHELRHSVTDVDVVSLGHPDSDIEFLKEVREGRSIGEEKGHLLPIENWGSLKLLGPDVEALEQACRTLDINLDEVFLKDISDSEVLGVIDLLRALREEVPIDHLIPPFVIGPPAQSGYSEDNWIPAGYRIPLVANFKDKGIVIWVEGEGLLYDGPNGAICGFQVRTARTWSTEVRPTRFSKGLKPELWLAPEWPPIPLLTPVDSIKTKFEGGRRLEFGGDVWPISEA
jgi:hypothetical protein